MIDWEGQTILDPSGEKVGKIEEIFLVEDTGRPEWGLVKLGRIKGRATLVPLTRAHLVKGGVRVHVSKDVIAEAPEVKADAEPSQQQVEALYRHYGLDAGGSQSSNGGTSPRQQPAAASAAGENGNPPAPSSPPAGGAGGSGDRRDAPVGDLLQTAKEEGANIVGQELKLAKAEMADKAKHVGIGAGMFGGAGYVASLAGIALTLCVIYALGEAMALWLAALITTVLLGAVAAVLALTGRKRIQKAGPPIPEQTVDSVKQTIQTVKEETKWGLGQTR